MAKQKGPLTKQNMKLAQVAIRELLDAYGSNQSQLAGVLGESAPVVSYACKVGRVSIRLAQKIGDVIGGKFTREYMRPDVKFWPND